MEKKMTEAFRKRVQATPGVATAEEEDIKLQGFKESVNELLSAVLSTVEDNPELKGKVCARLCVDLSVPLAAAPMRCTAYLLHSVKCVAHPSPRCSMLSARLVFPHLLARSAPTSASTAAMLAV
jgi:hypothetical protein